MYISEIDFYSILSGKIGVFDKSGRYRNITQFEEIYDSLYIHTVQFR